MILSKPSSYRTGEVNRCRQSYWKRWASNSFQHFNTRYFKPATYNSEINKSVHKTAIYPPVGPKHLAMKRQRGWGEGGEHGQRNCSGHYKGDLKATELERRFKN